ncbi:hypothetical protein DRQ12_08415, partial [candidate division KSB1 bacterium]
GLYQKAFLTAKFAKKSQGSQRGNCLFIKTLPTYFCGRALQNSIPSVSGDVSYNLFLRCFFESGFNIFIEN